MTGNQALTQAGLTTRETEVLAAWCFDCQTQEEIASRYGISQQAVAKSISKAQAKLSKVGLDAKRMRQTERPKMLRLDDVDETEIVATF